jgi:tetratricopeptide (TPR) repeat protein
MRVNIKLFIFLALGHLKQYIGQILVLLASLTLVACNTVPTSSDVTDEAETTAVEDESTPPEQVKIVKIEPVRPKIELTEDLLFKLLVAEIAGQRGQLDISVENYLQLANETKDPKVVELATRVAVYARNNEAASEAAQLWVELDPRNADAHQILAVMALRQGDEEQTLEQLEDILEYTDGELSQKLYMVVNLLGRERNQEMVMSIMERLIAGREDNPDALFAYANVAARMSRLDKSLELLERVLEMAPENDNAAMSYISILQRQGRINDAVTWLEASLPARGEDDFTLRHAYARLLTDAQRFEDARRQFEMLSVSEPDNTDIMYALGLLYLQSNRLLDAELYFNKLIDINDQFDNAKYYLGRIAEQNQDFEEAITWYEGVRQGENHFDSQIRFSLLKAQTESIAVAREHLKKIQSNGERQNTILVQAEAELLLEEDRMEEALDVYSNALYAGYNADLLYSRAMLAERMDRVEVLERDLLRIITREPNNVNALNALGYTLADRTDRYDEAYEYINRALQLRPDDFMIIDSMGWVLYRMGKLEEAKEFLQKAMDIRHDPEIAAHLIEVLWVMGNEKEAKKVSETALQTAPGDTRLLDVIERFNPRNYD